MEGGGAGDGSVSIESRGEEVAIREACLGEEVNSSGAVPGMVARGGSWDGDGEGLSPRSSCTANTATTNNTSGLGARGISGVAASLGNSNDEDAEDADDEEEEDRGGGGPEIMVTASSGTFSSVASLEASSEGLTLSSSPPRHPHAAARMTMASPPRSVENNTHGSPFLSPPPPPTDTPHQRHATHAASTNPMYDTTDGVVETELFRDDDDRSAGQPSGQAASSPSLLLPPPRRRRIVQPVSHTPAPAPVPTATNTAATTSTTDATSALRNSAQRQSSRRRMPSNTTTSTGGASTNETNTHLDSANIQPHRRGSNQSLGSASASFHHSANVLDDPYQQLLRANAALMDMHNQMDERFNTVLASQRRDFDRVFAMLQAEASRQNSLNSRLHAQLLLQSESMVAMELKVLRLEAKVERRDRKRTARSRSAQHQLFHNTGASGVSGSIIGGIERVEEEDVPLDIPVVRHHSHRQGSHRQNRSRHDSMESDERPAVVVDHPPPPAAVAAPLQPTRGGTANPRSSPTNLIGAAFVGSSGASLASGFTATSGEGGFMDGDDEEENADADAEDDGGASSNEDDSSTSTSENGGANESDSTPTQGSRHSQRIVTLDPSILQRPPCSGQASEQSDHGHSTRATRPPPDNDGASSLATSVTGTTLTSTVVTATTRGSVARTSRGDVSTHGGSTVGGDDGNEYHPIVHVTREPVLTTLRDGGDSSTVGSGRRARQENIEMVFGISPRRSSSGGIAGGAAGSTASAGGGERGEPRAERSGPGGGGNAPRSRSQSPLTVQDSVAQESQASASVATSSVGISSTAAVAPSRAFSSRRAAAAAAHAAASAAGDPNRPLTNRVVQFVFNPTIENLPPASVGVVEGGGGAGDSVTIPDELDNLSDVVDVFTSSSRRWRDDYESRLDALQKKFPVE